ncbi:hypothetical protein EVAR_36443_1 [Eumeta japonica]|uniref:Uncharacterized protein n=1 Tax=Eumeta variegata TaxID=151549 RepID=A0A4C1VQS5_EUMVA|nr:hypothetical protein EVAR_36443_1 [Eumeta japonica]
MEGSARVALENLSQPNWWRAKEGLRIKRPNGTSLHETVDGCRRSERGTKIASCDGLWCFEYSCERLLLHIYKPNELTLDEDCDSIIRSAEGYRYIGSSKGR